MVFHGDESHGIEFVKNPIKQTKVNGSCLNYTSRKLMAGSPWKKWKETHQFWGVPTLLFRCISNPSTFNLQFLLANIPHHSFIPTSVKSVKKKNTHALRRGEMEFHGHQDDALPFRAGATVQHLSIGIWLLQNRVSCWKWSIHELVIDSRWCLDHHISPVYGSWGT